MAPTPRPDVPGVDPESALPSNLVVSASRSRRRSRPRGARRPHARRGCAGRSLDRPRRDGAEQQRARRDAHREGGQGGARRAARAEDTQVVHPDVEVAVDRVPLECRRADVDGGRAVGRSQGRFELRGEEVELDGTTRHPPGHARRDEQPSDQQPHGQRRHRPHHVVHQRGEFCPRRTTEVSPPW